MGPDLPQEFDKQENGEFSFFQFIFQFFWGVCENTDFQTHDALVRRGEFSRPRPAPRKKTVFINSTLQCWYQKKVRGPSKS